MSMSRTSFVYLVITIICSLVFALLAAYSVQTPSTGLDVTILSGFAEYRSGTADVMFRYLTWAGSFYVLGPLSLFIGYLLLRRHQQAQAWQFLCSFMLAALAARVLKYLLGRERPDLYPALVDTFTAYSFPSSHAAQISAFGLALFLLLPANRRAWRVLLGAALLLLATSVMLSRLYLQVHYPSDVLAGGLLGVLSVALCAQTFRKR